MNWDATQQILLTATPVVALLIAWSGLNTWRRQLKGSHDFDLSRRLLLSVYRCEDALRVARNSFVQLGESDKNSEDWEASAYENRWRAVVDAMSELRATIMESKASWGEDFSKELKDLHKLVMSFMSAVRHYLAAKQNGPNSRVFSENDEAVLWGTDRDDYEKELEGVVKAFEQKIRPRLDRK